MTELEMWKIMWELWQWLAYNPGERKDRWPGWENHERMASDCPCCEYVRLNGDGCNECPALELWGTCCCDDNTCFANWYDACNSEAQNTEEISHYAQIIADYAKKKYEELLKEQQQ